MASVSLVIPAYNERDNLAPLLIEIDAALGNVVFEVVLVDDGSTDGSSGELERLRLEHRCLKTVSLEERSGQSSALMAGFDVATRDVVVTMDADGQNDPADIPDMLTRLESEPVLSAVVGYRVGRMDSLWKRFQSRVANVVRNRLTGDGVRDTGCPLKAMRREALSGIPRFDGMHRFLPTLIRMSGGVVVEVPVSHRPRWSGASKYGMWNRATRALRDALGVRWLSRRALHYRVLEVTR
jgi:glycosyltransferase involved in cell wall biosynthesis